MSTSDIDFVSFQVRDIEASARFYTEVVGLTPIPVPNPHAKAFSDGTVTFAVRVPMPGFDLDAVGTPGAGIAVWFKSQDPAAVHEKLVSAGATIAEPPFEGPFGTTFSFRDLDGYLVTIHAA
ncbi:VOC family protein [Frondihabitans australicus]|uniref:VOC domain-containing protein n=1 Tax=Frondihabitans australicus TaxID=386892 RepID=A0A495ILE6_9MICO|nr:VOC family protein [Frondihabitans australicus]RKR75955.1 hypothetical protein C8E83_3119 [Frondihabitans australicus]